MTPSHEISPNSRHFGKEERQYLYKIYPAMQNPVQISNVRMWLEKAQAAGLDPRRLYEAAVDDRPSHWTPSPPYRDVIPAS